MNNKNIIKTSHELNHFRGGYTRLELDFIYAFISTIKDEDEKFKDYKLTILELEKKLNKRLQIEKIEYIFDSLIKKSFKINNGEKLAIYSFFTYLEFDKETKTLTVNFNEKLKPHLLKLSTYAKGNLKYILQFKSEYSKRFYMLISQWKKAGTVTYSIEELREILAVPKSYLYADFKRKILKKAQKELKEKSDVYFEFYEDRRRGGKKVTHLIFDIIKSRGDNKEKLTIEDMSKYKGKTIYYNGEDRQILNVWEVKEEKGYVLVQLIDASDDTMTEKLHISQLEKMIEYAENRQPTLI